MFELCCELGGRTRCFTGGALSEYKNGQRADIVWGWGTPAQMQAFASGLTGGVTPQMLLAGYQGELAPVFQTFRAGGAVVPICVDGRAVGVRYEDAVAEYALLWGVLPGDVLSPRGAQTTTVFEGMERALNLVGMNFGHVVRTWFYLNDILAWYDEFNRARDAFFASRDVYNRMIPASTGIGIGNLAGAGLIAGAIAVKPKSSALSIRVLASPLQCSAVDYKSSFSRAVELAAEGRRMVLVSGTASIEPGGQTAFVGDIVKQTELTMQVIEAILSSRGLSFANTVQGIVYLKDPAYLSVWKAWLREHGLESLPITAMTADVCRDDLLVEVELIACGRV